MNKGLGIRIKALRQQKLSYNEIAKQLDCSKGSVSYWCGANQQRRTAARGLRSAERRKNKKNASRAYLREFSWRYKQLCGCKHCGIINPQVLQYDHIDPTNKLLMVSQMIQSSFSLKTVKEEIRKCQILCANCHLIKTSKQFNYYKFKDV